MSVHDQALLLRRLNTHCQQAMEAAAALCQTRGHAEITVDHLFIKLLELGDGDVNALLRRYEIDLEKYLESFVEYDGQTSTQCSW